METAISVKNLRKSFPAPTKENKRAKHQVLKGVDFTVRKGEIFALLGSNGAGKTTIINILSTLMQPDGGTAELCDAMICGYDVVKNADEVRKLISLTGQFAAVDEILTGRENLILIAKLRNQPNPEKVADDLLDRFGLKDAGQKRAGTYSGGMTRRLDIAMSLIGDPQVIFLDEPTTGLDPEAKLEVWRTIKRLAKSGTTILLTTQYLDEAEQLADRIAILNGGKIIANGTMSDLKKLFPPAKKEYVEKQPTLEEIFLNIIRKNKEEK
jgi:ABC-2 type transport system ATP-binding protein